MGIEQAHGIQHEQGRSPPMAPPHIFRHRHPLPTRQTHKGVLTLGANTKCLELIREET